MQKPWLNARRIERLDLDIVERRSFYSEFYSIVDWQWDMNAQEALSLQLKENDSRFE